MDKNTQNRIFDALAKMPVETRRNILGLIIDTMSNTQLSDADASSLLLEKLDGYLDKEKAIRNYYAWPRKRRLYLESRN